MVEKMERREDRHAIPSDEGNYSDTSRRPRSPQKSNNNNELAEMTTADGMQVFSPTPDFNQSFGRINHEQDQEVVEKPETGHALNENADDIKQEMSNSKLLCDSANTSSDVIVLNSNEEVAVDKGEVKSDVNNVTANPPKRRPGRPPGSTKNKMRLRNRLSTDGKFGDGMVKVPNDYSLRRFYEAGGRDYNEYLEWLKKREEQENNRTEHQNQILIERNGLGYGHLFPNKDGGLPPFPMMNGVPFTQQQMYMARLGNPPGHVMQTVPFPHHQQHTLPQQNLGQVSVPNGISNKVSINPPPSVCVQQNGGLYKDPDSERCADNCILDLSSKRRKIHENDFNTEKKCCLQEDGNQYAFVKNYEAKRFQANAFDVQNSFREKEEAESTTDSDVASWDIENVAKFVSSVPGCQDYADAFREHRIDGTTLPHLSEEHLLNFVKMKLGPAIRLLLEIQRIAKRN